MRKDENKRSSQSEEKINVKRFLRKRWVVPAIYLIAAAGVLSSIFFLQGKDESAQPENNVEVTDTANKYGENAVEVTSTSEIVKLPIEDENDFTVVNGFYDVDASEEEQQAALVYYNNSYYPNQGIDYAHVNGESFNVVAALSGTVTKAEKDPALGYVIEISHDHNFVTHYHSLEDIDVEIGSTVEQGEILGRAGRNLYNEEAGVHVHFEIRQDDVALNPNDVFQQPIDVISTELGKKDKDKTDKDKEAGDKEEDPKEKPEAESSSEDEQTQDDDGKAKDKDKDKEKDDNKENN